MTCIPYCQRELIKKGIYYILHPTSSQVVDLFIKALPPKKFLRFTIHWKSLSDNESENIIIIHIHWMRVLANTIGNIVPMNNGLLLLRYFECVCIMTYN